MMRLAQKIKNKLSLPLPVFKLLNRSKPHFECPVCGYIGPFMDLSGFAGVRKHAVCPQCRALERHRLQFVAVMEILEKLNVSKLKMLHFAPESFFRRIFSARFGKYETADLTMKNVDHKVDLQSLPFDDSTYDFIFASHVLEHIPDDQKAIGEIRRILKPNGIAILPVPVVCGKTIEYPKANPHEAYHMRAPGLDYFEKYKPHFSRVDVRVSGSAPEKYQLFIYEDRSVWPTRECPLRPPMPGERHADMVPICYV
jgi:SAM-dependent methyltransferase